MTMQHQVMWATVCLTDDEGVDHYVHRGATVPEWVPPYTLFALTSAGALQPVDRGPASPAVPETVPETAPATDAGDELVKPSPEDPKTAWVEYASNERNADRITRDQANGLTKSALMERYK